MPTVKTRCWSLITGILQQKTPGKHWFRSAVYVSHDKTLSYETDLHQSINWRLMVGYCSPLTDSYCGCLWFGRWQMPYDFASFRMRLRFLLSWISAVRLLPIYSPQELTDFGSWYMKKGPDRYTDAFNSLKRLRRTSIQSARGLFYIHCLITAERHIRTNHRRFSELISVPRNRRAMVASLIVMFLQKMCGRFCYEHMLIFRS